MAKALSIVQHPVNDYAAWRTVYDQVQPLRDKHGVNALTKGYSVIKINSAQADRWVTYQNKTN